MLMITVQLVCVETAVPGKWGYRCTGMSYMNFPKSFAHYDE